MDFFVPMYQPFMWPTQLMFCCFSVENSIISSICLSRLFAFQSTKAGINKRRRWVWVSDGHWQVDNDDVVLHQGGAQERAVDARGGQAGLLLCNILWAGQAECLIRHSARQKIELELEQEFTFVEPSSSLWTFFTSRTWTTTTCPSSAHIHA